jgi:hypothetical protein
MVIEALGDYTMTSQVEKESTERFMCDGMGFNSNLKPA